MDTRSKVHLEQVKSSAEQLSRNIAGLVTDNDVADKAKVELYKAKDAMAEQGKKADEYVRKNPWQSVAIAAAVAALVGLIFGRKK